MKFRLYRNNMKNRECGKETPQNFCQERATIAQEQDASEDKNFEVKSTLPKTDSLCCFGILTILYGFLLFLLSCTSDSSKIQKQLLRLNIHSEPPSLDPRRATDTTSIHVLKMCFDGLMRNNEKGQIVPALAEKIDSSEDYVQFTFYLRDAQWSDGKKITAYDFEETWKTILSPSFPSEFAYELYILKNAKAYKENRCQSSEVGVKAIDAKTLYVELEHPVPYFLSLIATHCFFAVPKHITNAFPNWADHAGDHYVVSGPFQMKTWRHNNEIILEKNPRYWDAPAVKLSQIHLTMIEDESTELSMFENGELDWVGSPLSALPADALPSLSKRHKLEFYPVSGVYYYIFNTKTPPFDNTNIRRALSLAINRKEIIDNITQGKQLPATGLIPPTMLPRDATYFRDGDIKEARRLFHLGLQEIGISMQDFPAITLSYNTLAAHHKIAQAIQQQWFKAFGIKVMLENKEWKVFLNELGKHQFQVARMGGIATYNDPTSFLDLYKYASSSNNFSLWVNPAFSTLLENADIETNPEKRLMILQQAEELLISEMPIAPIYFYTGCYLKKPYVKGVYLSELNDIDFKSTYLEE